jgi:L,D-transpeptidase YcbB
MHDTPSRNLFVRDDRARSHGCVRLEHPMDLALELLKDNKNWPRERIEQKIAGGATIRIELADGPPVVFAYWTAFVDDDGTVEFRSDIYGVDARIAATLALDGKGTAPAKSANAETVVRLSQVD